MTLGDTNARKADVSSTTSVLEVGVSGNRIQAASQQVTRTLLEQLQDPANWTRLKRTKSTIRLSKYNLAMLSKLEAETGLLTHNASMSFLLESIRRENQALPANLKLLLHDDAPICLTGPSGSGKTLFLKRRVLPIVNGPLLLVDVASEYPSLTKTSIAQLYERKWAKAGPEDKLRFVPSSNLDIARGELRSLFSLLNMIKADGFNPEKRPSGSLSQWLVIVEEGHRLFHYPVFNAFLAEARKHLRKLITVCSDPTMYGSICRLVKPPPLEELLDGS